MSLDGVSKSEAGKDQVFFNWGNLHAEEYGGILDREGGLNFRAMPEYVAFRLDIDPGTISAEMLMGEEGDKTSDAIDQADEESTLRGFWLLLDQQDPGEEAEENMQEMWVEYDRENEQFSNSMGVVISREEFESRVDKIIQDTNGITFWAVKNKVSMADTSFSVN